jgi:hypothetical protein
MMGGARVLLIVMMGGARVLLIVMMGGARVLLIVMMGGARVLLIVSSQAPTTIPSLVACRFQLVADIGNPLMFT